MAAPASAPGRLRTGSLSIWEAIGISVALMAPSMAANINPQGTVGLVGRAVPLAFVFATVGVLLISYGIVRLCQYYNHAGSVFGFVGVTLGPRTGVLAGWTLIGTYTLLRLRHERGGRHLRRRLPRPHRRLEQPARLAAVPDRVHRTRRRVPARHVPGAQRDASAALARGHHRAPDHRRRDRRAREGHQRRHARQPELHARRVQADRRHGHRRCLQGRRSSASSRSPASRPRRPWVRRRATRVARSRARSSASRSSAASTSSSSPRSR